VPRKVDVRVLVSRAGRYVKLIIAHVADDVTLFNIAVESASISPVDKTDLAVHVIEKIAPRNVGGVLGEILRIRDRFHVGV
jgi:hypothetical protein